ncbi:MAG: TonB-dependent receptor [Sideroxydans sp.]|nr:TonB-dependent receptor [Sideroxydans sp.]
MLNHATFAIPASTLLLLAGAAYAESEPDYLQEFPVVLSAARLNQPLSEAPNAMTVIDRAMITASGLRSLPDVFKLVPSMYVSYYKGSQPIVSYHGSFDQYAHSMQVLIDGRSVYMPPTSLVDWAALPITLADIERIEVIRGPAAASYGANSVHGVINIITRDAGAQHGSSVAITRGTKGINDVQGQFGAHREQFDYRMTLGYTADNGYDDRTATHLPSAFAPDMNNSNDSNQARLLNYRATYYPNNRDSFDVQLGGNRDVQGVGFWDSQSQLNPFHDLINTSSLQMLTWLHQTDNHSEVSTRLAHTLSRTQERFSPGLIPQAASSNVSASRSVLTVQHNVPLSEVQRVVYGVELNQDQAQGQVNYLGAVHHNAVSLPATRLFAHDEYRVTEQLISNLGAMWEHEGQHGTKFSPRGSFNFHLSAEHTLRVGASRAYRTPSIAENYNSPALAYQIGDRFTVGTRRLNLASEKILSREIGYLGQFNQRASSLDIRVFNDQFSDVIYPIANGFANGLAGSYNGIETTFKHSFSSDTHLTFNHAREYARSNVNALQAGQGDLLAASTPVNTVSALFAQQFAKQFGYSVAYYQQGALQPFDRGSTDYQRMHKRVDVRVTQGLQTWLGVHGEVAWVVQNLFKDNYTEYVASNVFNQRTYVTLKLDF